MFFEFLSCFSLKRSFVHSSGVSDFLLCIQSKVPWNTKTVPLPYSSGEIPVATILACSNPRAAESMEKKSSRWFSRFLCCSARTPSSPDAKHRTPRPLHPSITTEGPSSSNIPPIPNDGQNCGYSSSLPINNAPPVSSPSSLTINKGPTVPSSSQSNTITDNDLQPLPTSSNVQTVDTVSLFQANPSTADVLEESSSQPSEIVVAHPDEPLYCPPPPLLG